MLACASSDARPSAAQGASSTRFGALASIRQLILRRPPFSGTIRPLLIGGRIGGRFAPRLRDTSVDYHFRPIGRTCAATGSPLVPGERAYSVVVEQNGELVRQDYSPSGWRGPPPGALGQWRCTVPHPETKAGTGPDPDALLSYFEQLAEDANPAHNKLRYVLALFLLQKRRLRLDGSRVDADGEFLQLSGSRGEGPYEIRDQQLAEAEIKELQAELNQHVAGRANAA
jgi:hypothetical protein